MLQPPPERTMAPCLCPVSNGTGRAEGGAAATEGPRAAAAAAVRLGVAGKTGSSARAAPALRRAAGCCGRWERTSGAANRSYRCRARQHILHIQMQYIFAAGPPTEPLNNLSLYQ